MSVIILDPGKSALKGIKLNPKYELENVLMLKSKTERRLTFNGNEDSAKSGQYEVDIPDVGRFIVGEGIENYNSEHTKVNIHTKVCILTGIALLLNQNEPIDLVLGCPSSDYANKQLVQEYKNMIPTKKFSMVVNDEIKLLDIRRVFIFPEGMMFKTRMTCKQLYPEVDIINCIDIGGYNTNLRQYDKVGNLLKYVSLNNAGINSLETYLSDQLRSVINSSIYSIDDINMSKCISQGYIAGVSAFNADTYANSEEFLKFNICNYIENNILNKLMLRGIDLKSKGNLNALSGGGSHIVKKYMSDYLQSNFDNIYYTEDPQFENIASYLSRYLLHLTNTKALSMEEATQLVSKLLSYNFSNIITIGGRTLNDYDMSPFFDGQKVQPAKETTK